MYRLFCNILEHAKVPDSLRKRRLQLDMIEVGVPALAVELISPGMPTRIVIQAMKLISALTEVKHERITM